MPTAKKDQLTLWLEQTRQLVALLESEWTAREEELGRELKQVHALRSLTRAYAKGLTELRVEKEDDDA